MDDFGFSTLILKVLALNIPDYAYIDEFPVLVQQVLSLGLLKHDQPQQVDKSNFGPVLCDFGQSNKLVNLLVADGLEVKTRKPVGEKVQFDLIFGLFDNFLDKLLHFVDLTGLSVSNWEQIHRLELFISQFLMVGSLACCGLRHRRERALELSLVSSAEFSVLFAVQVEVEGWNR